MRFNILQKMRSGSAPLRRRFAYLAWVNDIKKFPIADHRGIALIDDIIMKENTGMIQVYLTTSSQEYSYETVGDTDSKIFKVKFNGTHPGTEQEALEFSKNYLEEGFVVLIPSCDEGVKVLGSPDAPLVFTSSHKSEKAGEKFNFVFEQEIGSDTVYQLYTGLITLNNNIEVDMGDFLEQLKNYMKLDGTNLTEAQKQNLKVILGSDGKHLGNSDLSLSDNRGFNLKSYFLNFFNNAGLAKIGINKTAPTESLDVIGNIRTDSVILNESPSDIKIGSVFRIENDVFIKTENGTEKLVKSGDYVLDDHGIISPDTLPPSSGWVKGWYAPKVASVFPGTNYPNCNNLKADSANFTKFYYNGSSWESLDRLIISQAKKIFDPVNNNDAATMMATSARYDSLLDTEATFNAEAVKFGSFSIISRDLSSVSMPNKIASGEGSSIYTCKLAADSGIRKLRIKVNNAGVGNFTFKREGVKSSPISGVKLVPGWNDVYLNFDGLKDDFIGYNTATSTAEINFGSNTGGPCYLDNGTLINDSIALEVYDIEEPALSFQEIVTPKESEGFGTQSLEIIDKLSTPKLREFDYGVVSVFSLPETKDILGNNRIKKSGGSVVGDFKVQPSYALSFGFVCSFAAINSGSLDILNLDLGTHTLKIYAGGSGIGVTAAGQQNGFAFDYANKDVSFVIVVDAFYTFVYVNGSPIGFEIKGKLTNKLQFNFPQLNNQLIKNVTYWNRKISRDRVSQWGDTTKPKTYLNPFNLASPEDRLFPGIGYQISDHLLKGNLRFDVPGEQTIVKFKGKYFMYYTASKGTEHAVVEAGVAVAVSNKIDSGYSMFTNDVVIGGVNNKAGVTRAMASWAGVIGEEVFVFAAIDYNVNNAGSKIFKSSDGLNFTLVSDFIPGSGIPFLANIGICKEKQSDGRYYGIVEGRPSDIWQCYLVRSAVDSFTTGWEVVQMLPSLQIGAGKMYGGADLFKSANGDRWQVIYHAAYEGAGNQPTACYYAECFDTGAPINWVNKKMVKAITDELEFYEAYNCDQTATPQLYEEAGVTYISYVLAQNNPTLHCQIRIAKFNGTKEELFGIVPLDFNQGYIGNIEGKGIYIGTGGSTGVDLPLRGKIIAWYGTSIPAGYPHTDDRDTYSYANRAVKALGGSIQNYCVSSSTIRAKKADGSSMSSGRDGIAFTNAAAAVNYQNSMLNLIGTANEPDLFVFDFGINDRQEDVSDMNTLPGTNSVDVNTFYGAYNFVFKKLLEARPTARILILSHISNDSFDTAGYYKPVNDVVKVLAEKWNIERLYVHEKAQFVNNGVFTNWFTYLPDGVHPGSDTSLLSVKVLEKIATEKLKTIFVE